MIVEAELDTGAVARRLRKEIGELYGHAAEVQVLAAAGMRKGTRYVVRVVAGGDSLARQTGLIDQRGRPVRGLPPQIVAGSVGDAEAAWRGAFLAHGSLTEPGRSASLEITCPGPEAALALVGAARRMGIGAKAREVRGADRVLVRDGDAIAALLTRLGAHASMMAWEERRMRREVRATANRLANFDDANLRRSARAAVAARRPGRTGAGDPRRRGPRAPEPGRPAADRAPPGVAGGTGPAGRPADDQGRRRRPDPAAADHGRQARRRPRHPGHRIRGHRRHAGRGVARVSARLIAANTSAFRVLINGNDELEPITGQERRWSAGGKSAWRCTSHHRPSIRRRTCVTRSVITTGSPPSMRTVPCSVPTV